MKKIPTLFKRVFEGKKKVDILDEITPGCEEAFKNGVATVKYDGSCCAIIEGELYKRYDAKNGKTPPANSFPCCAPDPITGHWPHWVPVDATSPADKWFVAAAEYTFGSGTIPCIDYQTFEAVGPHFNGNPTNYTEDHLIPHGEDIIYECEMERTFEGVRKWLENHEVEGIVFWLNGEPVCKIKRSDFGLSWPVK